MSDDLLDLMATDAAKKIMDLLERERCANLGPITDIIRRTLAVVDAGAEQEAVEQDFSGECGTIGWKGVMTCKNRSLKGIVVHDEAVRPEVLISMTSNEEQPCDYVMLSGFMHTN